MPQLRHDPIQKRWVIVATERALRPSDFTVQPKREDGGFCPFCEGNETKTPPEILCFRKPGSAPNGPGWEVRVVPNKYPALKIEGDLGRRGVGLYDVINGIGAHEVVIETPQHTQRMAEYADAHLAKIIMAYRERIKDLARDGRFRYILIFKNEGLAAGASLAHSHTQLIATPVTPRTVSLELDSARDHYRLKERCLFCDIISEEISARERIVSENETFIAACPFASRFPFEVLLAPRNHSHDFTHLSDIEAHSLARILKDILWRLKMSLSDPPYNFLLHTCPNTETIPRRPGYWGTLAYDFHWHIEIIPRITRVAGFEWGTGFYINPTPPEEAAKYMRELRR